MTSFPTGTVRWGILGCGDVTEVKSGPALAKAPRSSVAAVMRRDAAKAEDYAQRHAVARWYSDAEALIADDTVDAVYIATPPDSHARYAIRALEAGKPVLCEKPMALSVAECDAMQAAAGAVGLPLTVAYYRRALPRFEKMREIIHSGDIGTPRTVLCTQHRRSEDRPGQSWKLDPSVGGGGHFADMYSHAIDWLDHTFGPARVVSALVRNQAGAYGAEDLVSFIAEFGEGVVATGLCSYASDRSEDRVTVTGTAGAVSMGFFGPSPVYLARDGEVAEIALPDPPHVHQPFVEQVVACLLDGAPNPCDAATARRAVTAMTAIYGT